MSNEEGKEARRNNGSGGSQPVRRQSSRQDRLIDWFQRRPYIMHSAPDFCHRSVETRRDGALDLLMISNILLL